MKQIIILFTIILCCQNVMSQDIDEISEDINKLTSSVDSLKTLLRENSVDTLSIIGSIHIPDWDQIPVKKMLREERRIKPERDSVLIEEYPVDIERLTLIIKDGYLIEAQVFSRDTTEKLLKFNNRGPIGITTAILDKGNYLYHQISPDHYYLLFTKDLWTYEGFGSYSPNNGTYKVNKDEYDDKYPNGIQLTKDSGINSILDLKLFTDGLATFGNQSNGLVQTTASFKHIIHRNNRGETGFFYPAHYMKLNVNLKKFDSKFATIDTSDFTRSKYIQQSWLTSDLSFSLLDIWVEKKSMSTAYIDIGAKIFLSNVGDENNAESTISHAFFLEPGLNMRIAENLGTDLALNYMWHYAPEIDFIEQEKIHFLNTDFKVYWNPLGDTDNKLFGQLSHTIDLNNQNSFFQLQFGYSLRLSDMVGK